VRAPACAGDFTYADVHSAAPTSTTDPTASAVSDRLRRVRPELSPCFDN
jgi:hypothetical protein